MGTKLINNSLLIYDDQPSLHIKEFYDYCLNFLKKTLEKKDTPIIVIFGDLPYTTNRKIKTLKIDIQCEHTLVKNGGRGVDKNIFGKVPDNEGNNYLVRIDKFEYLNGLDVIIEYSHPNYQNILLSEVFGEYIKKNFVISPLLLTPTFNSGKRTEIITLFSENASTRRTVLFNELININKNIKNISYCFDNECLVNLYKKTKILINIHQTDHHHTFEELRILPALSQGVLIISEDVPLKENIPYGEFIIWSKYEDITNTLKDVEENYDYYYNKIFNGSISKSLELIEQNNINQFTKLLN